MSDEGDDQQPERRTKHQKDWRCPECGNVITTFTRLSATPICANQEKHAARAYEFVEVKQ